MSMSTRSGRRATVFAIASKPGGYEGHDFVAQPFEQVSQIFCDDRFVFDNENARSGHR
jgi:hypothetical protein